MLIRTYADIEKLEGKDALSPAENKLIKGCKRGELTTLGNGTRPKRSSKARTIRADLLRYLILGGCEQCRVHENGVQLMGAWISGKLDLNFASAKGTVHLLLCAFAEPIVADQASFNRLVLSGSRLPGLNADGAAIKGDILLREVETTGEVSLSGAEIGGQLLANGAVLNGDDGMALNAQGATIRGGAFLDNLRSTGEVSFGGAEIGGQLSCSGAALNGGVGKALYAQNAKITGGAFLQKLKSTGEVSFGCAQIGVQLSAEEAVLNGGEGSALNAQSATIRGGAFLDNLKSAGEVSLAGAEIDGQLSCSGAELNGGEGPALNAQSAMIRGGAFLDNLESTGEIIFAGADIGGQLSCNGAELNGGKGTALNAQGATIRGHVFLDEAKSTGEVFLLGADIAGQFSCNGAELNGGEGMALIAQSAIIRGGAFLDSLKSTGEVSFVGAEIKGQLSAEEAELNGGKGKALNAQRMIVHGNLFWRKIKLVFGTVDLSNTHIGDLTDDEQSWDAVSSLILVGATYEDLSDPHNLPFRKRWLQKGASPESQFHPQPYQQLAKFYRETGHRHEAREILIEKEKEQRKAVRASIRRGVSEAESDVQFSLKTTFFRSWYVTKRWFGFFLWRWLRIGGNWLWDILIRYIAGYGYKPWLSLGWLSGLVLIMMLAAKYTWDAGDFAPNSAIVLTSPEWKALADLPEVYTQLSEHSKQMIVEDMIPAHPWTAPDAPGKDYETFYSFAYALDVVVPVLDLGQTDAWAPSPARGDWGYRLFYLQKIFIVAGWLVTAIAAAAISGMIRRDD